jgi:hypothetical protein
MLPNVTRLTQRATAATSIDLEIRIAIDGDPFLHPYEQRNAAPVNKFLPVASQRARISQAWPENNDLVLLADIPTSDF